MTPEISQMASAERAELDPRNGSTMNGRWVKISAALSTMAAIQAFIIQR